MINIKLDIECSEILDILYGLESSVYSDEYLNAGGRNRLNSFLSEIKQQII